VIKQTTPNPAKKSDAVAFILPDHVEDQYVEDVGESVPLVVGAPPPSLTERLRAALTNDAFELHAQRITPLHDYERPDRFEVLLRMPNKYGLQTPAAFMNAAEAGDLLPALDLWVIRHTLDMLRRDNRLGRRPRELSINLSAASLLDEKFLERALAEIRGSNIKLGQLGFEVSESVAIHHAQELRALAEPLQAAGCRIALDNCRIGLEIFDLIPQGSISCIKIDGSIVRQLGVSPSTNSLIESIVERATARGIESVAEHVESHLACSTVISVGVDYAQGYHLEAPAPLTKLFY
jgi:EAL domain-containing protein (putative c-di-GMP-specific phosphodiesterase class I)